MTASDQTPPFQPAEVRTFTGPHGIEAVAWQTDTPGLWTVPGSPITRLAPPGSGTALLVEAGTRYLPDPAALDLNGHRQAVADAIRGLAVREREQADAQDAADEDEAYARNALESAA